MGSDENNSRIGGGGLYLALAPLATGKSTLGAGDVCELLDAAADADFSGVSISTAHHDWAVADGISSEQFAELHRARGLTVASSEMIVGWATDDHAAVERAAVHQLDVSAAAGAADVVAVTIGTAFPPLPVAADGLAHLCDLAADRGLLVSFEFFPMCGVPTLAGAVRLVEAADRGNLGFVIDAWHWFREDGGPDQATLRSISPDRIHVLQLCDAPALPSADLIAETVGGRLLPGEGAIDLLGLLDVLAGMGADPIVASEVFSTPLAALGPAEFARRQHAALTAVLERHWATHRLHEER